MCSGRLCGKSVWLKHPGKPQFLLGELRACLEGMRDSKFPMQVSVNLFFHGFSFAGGFNSRLQAFIGMK